MQNAGEGNTAFDIKIMKLFPSTLLSRHRKDLTAQNQQQEAGGAIQSSNSLFVVPLCLLTEIRPASSDHASRRRQTRMRREYVYCTSNPSRAGKNSSTNKSECSIFRQQHHRHTRRGDARVGRKFGNTYRAR